ncbi:MAG: hypothetical protein ISR95_08790 [Candidatus Marinimicrobia bacterium]|nr:hypothetical protein [Candidatus Neomarinimicrobiota bacterium]
MEIELNNEDPIETYGNAWRRLPGIHYWDFENKLNCPICGKKLFLQDAFENNQPMRENCPHVLYFWEKTHSGGHFFYVRPDFAKKFIKALLKSDYYQEYLQKPKPRPLKNNEIAKFASGVISPADPMFNYSWIRYPDPGWWEDILYQKVSYRVGNISQYYPSLRHPEIHPEEAVIYVTDYSVGYTGLRIRNRKNSHGDYRTLYIAIIPSEYHNPGIRWLSD